MKYLYFFDDGLVVRAVFLCISKAFDKVWRKCIIFKLKQNGISGELLRALSDFLKDRKQRVTLNELMNINNYMTKLSEKNFTRNLDYSIQCRQEKKLTKN